MKMVDKLRKPNQKLNVNKLLILIIKIYPMVIAIGYFCINILHYFDISVRLFEFVTIQALTSTLLLYLLSYVFQFCLYHRIFIHYVLIQNVISYIDEIYTIPVSDKQFLYIQMNLLFVVLVIALFSYLRKKNLALFA